MRIELINTDRTSIAKILSDKIEISNVQDALDLMADCYYQGTRKIIINKKNITPDFFDLKTGIAGEILQKFSTYDIMLAIVGDYSEFTSNSLKDFIFESNKTGKICFVRTVEEAIGRMHK